MALGPVGAEDAHDERVADAAVDGAVIVAHPAFDDEAQLFVGAAGSLVLDEQIEVDAVGVGLGVEPVEGLAEKGRADALAGLAGGGALQVDAAVGVADLLEDREALTSPLSRWTK